MLIYSVNVQCTFTVHLCIWISHHNIYGTWSLRISADTRLKLQIVSLLLCFIQELYCAYVRYFMVTGSKLCYSLPCSEFCASLRSQIKLVAFKMVIHLFETLWFPGQIDFNIGASQVNLDFDCKLIKVKQLEAAIIWGVVHFDNSIKLVCLD